MSDTGELENLAFLGYERLLTGDAEGALPYLEQAIAEVQDRPRLKARLLSWKAQALLATRRPQKANRIAMQALKIARGCGDTEGVQALQDLQSQALAQAAAINAVKPQGTDETPLGAAVKALDEGRTQLGEILALGAREHARKQHIPRDEVFALLALARLPHRTGWAIEQARQVADRAGDKNLVTAVSRAAKAAGIKIKPQVF
ncbi:MAG: hypothetical protein AAFV53_32635 [Myxococcota bacterium]